MQLLSPPTAVRVLRGSGVSAGRARGRALRVGNAREAAAAGPGDVAVVDVLPAGWAPLVAHTAGVVAGEGGALSNAATVLRELRVPAVVGIGPAAAAIESGASISLDGLTGSVEVDSDAV
ncbi:MAG TPA: PEP-utilizing enzyme [Chloroflexota bacterium]|nr:PEP-utilizing enzyme [Chloroflexota bacterium]